MASGHSAAPKAGPSAGVPPTGPDSTVSVKPRTPSSSATAPMPAGMPTPRFTTGRLAPGRGCTACSVSSARRWMILRTSSGSGAPACRAGRLAGAAAKCGS